MTNSIRGSDAFIYAPLIIFKYADERMFTEKIF